MLIGEKKRRLNVMRHPKSHRKAEHWLKLCIKCKFCRRYRHMICTCVYMHIHTIYTHICVQHAVSKREQTYDRNRESNSLISDFEHLDRDHNLNTHISRMVMGRVCPWVWAMNYFLTSMKTVQKAVSSVN